MMWVLVCVASVELLVVHLLVALWQPWAAVVLSVLSLVGIGWLIGVIRSLKRLPVLLEPDRLVLRVGTLRRVEVPRANVAGLRGTWSAASLKRADVAKLSLIAWPNVVVELRQPLSGRRAVRLIAHRLDDAPAFAKALNHWLAAPSP